MTEGRAFRKVEEVCGHAVHTRREYVFLICDCTDPPKGIKVLRSKDPVKMRNKLIDAAYRLHSALVRLRAGSRCEWCRLQKPGDIDHIVPRSHGRDDRIPNLRFLCSGRDGCHERRHKDPKFSRLMDMAKLEDMSPKMREMTERKRGQSQSGQSDSQTAGGLTVETSESTVVETPEDQTDSASQENAEESAAEMFGLTAPAIPDEVIPFPPPLEPGSAGTEAAPSDEGVE